MGEKYKILIQPLSKGVPVLTVNNRLSRYILNRYERTKIEANVPTWDTPAVMPFSAWLRAFYTESWADRPILGEAHCLALFKKIISRDSSLPGMGITAPGGLAGAAYKAYNLIHQYNLRLPRDETYLTEEVRAFKGWLRQYEKELRSLGFIDDQLLMEQAPVLIAKGAVRVPKKIILAGFDEITPALESLLSALGGAGCEVSFWPQRPGILRASPPAETGTLEIREYPDMAGEVRAAARWTRTQVEEGRRTGIIVPELERYRDLIIREFSAELDPSSAVSFEQAGGPFNLSLGSPLADEPLVRSALDIISLNLKAVELERMSSIICSPYFLAGEAEHMALARLDKDLRDKRFFEISLWGLHKEAKSKRFKPILAGLQERLSLWIKTLKDKDKKGRRLPGQWAAYFDSLLTGLGWPSPGFTLNSKEYQALKAWHDLLGKFAGLDDVLGRLTWAGATAELRAMAAEAIHQPESPEGSFVEVLGFLEASGLEFECIWILGATEAALPGEDAPNPFIPLYLQKEAGLPRSSPEKTLEFASTSLERILKCAPISMASFPQAVEGVPLKVSPLLKDRGKYVKDPEPLAGHRHAESIRASIDLEDMPDDKEVPLSEAELRSLRGGTSIIKDQSACPFRAFALHRLGARALAVPEAGLDNMDRGTVAHEAMKFFWEEEKDSEHLALAHKEGRLSLLIKEAVTKALEEFHRPGVSAKMLELEAQRLQGLLSEWMEVELRREPFTVVEVEKGYKIHVGGLTISARLDRVDRLNEGGEVIIDYKTGACSKDYWLPGRPKEPQMLLYALESGFNAIAFASLKLPRTRFVGIGSNDGILPGVKGFSGDKKWRDKIEGADNWTDLNERWKEALTGLANEFKEGVARIDPNKELKGNDFPCTFCELMTFCRIFESCGYDGEED
ncbi:MAG: PD-(D/E)XK nuclease family protein [Thermodesulfobacteriota bacterium]